MERRIINPWAWQDEFGYVQANEVSGVQRTLYCSGQAANDSQGAAVNAGDMRSQITLALDTLETCLLYTSCPCAPSSSPPSQAATVSTAARLATNLPAWPARSLLSRDRSGATHFQSASHCLKSHRKRSTIEAGRVRALFCPGRQGGSDSTGWRQTYMAGGCS